MGNRLVKPEQIFEISQIRNIIKKFKKPIIQRLKRKYQENPDYPFDAKFMCKIDAYFRYIWNSYFSSPVERTLHNGAFILDLRCGTGTFLLDLCSQYQSSNFVGIDRRDDYFPRDLSKNSKNVKFIKHDILDGIPYADNTFDFIYMRFMMKYFTEAEWKTNIIPEIFRVCKRGGWIEIVDSDLNIYNAGPCTESYHRTCTNKFGLNYRVELDRLQDIMNIYKDIGITIIKEKINPWYPIQLQKSNKSFEMAAEFLNLLYPLMSNELKLNIEDYENLSRHIIKEIAENKTPNDLIGSI
ncbi:10167_t:CDS:2 [Funneliformis geosporum]|uniref:10167_t:CDS:1 n=1 Tax=Funneliformis geosporum TaxID=1117311 RepID=A0A9W4SRG7_9GLOM|nr:10167_t:CDS:2 [Funneliformis geosporum]